MNQFFILSVFLFGNFSKFLFVFIFQVIVANNSSSVCYLCCIINQLHYFITLALANIFKVYFFRLAMYVTEPHSTSLYLD